MDVLELALKTVKPARFWENLYVPNYQRNVFMVVPTAYSILEYDVKERRTLLDEGDIRRIMEESECTHARYVVALLLDSVGFKQISKSKLLSSAFDEGNLTLISSVFPTITPTVLASVHTGYPPEVHGFVGYKIYIPEIGNVVDTLRLCTTDAPEDEMLLKAGVNVRGLMWCNTIYEEFEFDLLNLRLAEGHIAKRGISKITVGEDRSIGYGNVIDCFSIVKKILSVHKDKRILIEVYIGMLDELAHKYGTNSEEYSMGLRIIEDNLIRLAKGVEDKIGEETVVLIFSDHGQTDLRREEVVKFKREDLERVKEWITARFGKSGRVMHFYVKEEHVDEFERWVEEKAKGMPVLRFEDVFDQIYPTGRNKEIVRRRVGDVIGLFEGIFDERGEQIIPMDFVSSHGSLSLNELVVPFAFFRLNDLAR